MTNCKRCKEKPASICVTCYHDLVAYYDQQIETLTAQAQAAPELLAALQVVWQAAIGEVAGDLSQFIAEGRGQLGVYLTSAELAQIKQALASTD